MSAAKQPSFYSLILLSTQYYTWFFKILFIRDLKNWTFNSYLIQKVPHKNHVKTNNIVTIKILLHIINTCFGVTIVDPDFLRAKGTARVCGVLWLPTPSIVSTELFTFVWYAPITDLDNPLNWNPTFREKKWQSLPQTTLAVAWLEFVILIDFKLEAIQKTNPTEYKPLKLLHGMFKVVKCILKTVLQTGYAQTQHTNIAWKGLTTLHHQVKVDYPRAIKLLCRRFQNWRRV